ncbi:MAG: GWxTD domain-containing protein [Ignavibacteria bacterium]
MKHSNQIELKFSSDLKKLLCLILISFISVLAFKDSYSQLSNKVIEIDSRDFFYFDPLVFYSKDEGKARLDVYLEIPLENLQFKKNYTTKNYDASITYNIKITNSFNEIVSNENITDLVSTSKAEQKNLESSSKYIVKEFYLNPGNYNLEITITDINTKKEKTEKGSVEITDFVQKDISASNIMLVSNVKEENGKKVITPLIARNIGNLKSIYLFFEVYNSSDKEVVNDFTYTITDSKENILEKDNLVYTLSPGINKYFEKVSTSNLIFGEYTIELTNNSTGEIVAYKEFENKLSGMPTNVKDLNILIDQMIYIASSEEITKIKNSKTPELKEKNFVEFWREKDPSPYTTKNELMVEYYKRIGVANERYSHYIDGWKTDMGMVFIIFGEPNNIERHPFNEGVKPYEIWEYYNENQQYIFVDETGFGDYKLTIPIWNTDANRIRY